MTWVLRTTDLGKHKGVGLSYGHSELMTLAPAQVNTPGSIVLIDYAGGVLRTAPSITFRTDPPGALDIRLGSPRSGGVDVAIRAKTLGKVVIYVGNEPVGAVTVGPHASHLGPRAVDLLARISNGPDARKIVAIQQIIQNRKAPAPIIDQHDGVYGDPSRLLCGTVAQRAGTALFGDVFHGGASYHEPIKAHGKAKMTFADIRYDPKVTLGAIARIKSHLDSGSAVRLGLVYNPEWSMLAPNGALQAERSGGHTVLVVGYVDDQFLYLDPFPGGSRVKYRGGLPFNKGMTCDYMGILGVTEERGKHLAAIIDEPLGPEFSALDVISGP